MQRPKDGVVKRNRRVEMILRDDNRNLEGSRGGSWPGIDGPGGKLAIRSDISNRRGVLDVKRRSGPGLRVLWKHLGSSDDVRERGRRFGNDMSGRRNSLDVVRHVELNYRPCDDHDDIQRSYRSELENRAIEETEMSDVPCGRS